MSAYLALRLIWPGDIVRRKVSKNTANCRSEQDSGGTFWSPRIVRSASVLENVMIGGAIDGEATFVGSLLSLPRRWCDELMLRHTAILALNVGGLAQLAPVRADRLQHSEHRFTDTARADVASGILAP
jgi:branched-chain amino acid transport system permease protein